MKSCLSAKNDQNKQYVQTETKPNYKYRDIWWVALNKGSLLLAH